MTSRSCVYFWTKEMKEAAKVLSRKENKDGVGRSRLGIEQSEVGDVFVEGRRKAGEGKL